MEEISAVLVDVLCSEGLEILDPLDELFDPNCHEAVAHESSIDEEGAQTVDGQVVVEVLRRGYIWGGQVLRPAMVKVRG